MKVIPFGHTIVQISRDLFSSCRRIAIYWAALVLTLGSGPAMAEREQIPEINVVTGSNSVGFAALWVALSERLFEKHEVKVNLLNFNATAAGAAMLAAGQADIMATTPGIAIRIAQQGKPVSILWGLADQRGLFQTVAARPGIKTMAQLQAMGDSCRMPDLPPGSGIAVLTSAYSRAYKLSCTTTIVGTAPLLVAAVASGQFDAAVMISADAYNLARQGKANILLDPAKLTPAEMKALYPFEHPVGVLFGIRSDLEGKREAVTRFMRAIREANERVVALQPNEVAKLLSSFKEVYPATPVESLEEQLRTALPSMPRGPRAGSISEANWNDLIAASRLHWNISVEPGSDAAMYSKMVDMSYAYKAR